MEQEKVRLQVDLLLKNYDSLSKEKDDGNNLFHLIALQDQACDTVNDAVIEELVKRGVDPNQKNNNDETPLWIAAISNNYELCRWLYACGANDAAEPILKALIPLGHMYYPGKKVGESPNDPPYNTYGFTKNFFGCRWFNEMRLKRLVAVELCLKKNELIIFNVNIRKKIISYLSKDFFPSFLLSRYKPNKSYKIKKKRDKEVADFIRQLELQQLK